MSRDVAEPTCKPVTLHKHLRRSLRRHPGQATLAAKSSRPQLCHDCLSGPPLAMSRRHCHRVGLLTSAAESTQAYLTDPPSLYLTAVCRFHRRCGSASLGSPTGLHYCLVQSRCRCARKPTVRLAGLPLSSPRHQRAAVSGSSPACWPLLVPPVAHLPGPHIEPPRRAVPRLRVSPTSKRPAPPGLPASCRRRELTRLGVGHKCRALASVPLMAINTKCCVLQQEGSF